MNPWRICLLNLETQHNFEYTGCQETKCILGSSKQVIKRKILTQASRQIISRSSPPVVGLHSRHPLMLSKGVCFGTWSCNGEYYSTKRQSVSSDVDKNWVESSKVSALLRELESFRLVYILHLYKQWSLIAISDNEFWSLMILKLVSRNNVSFLRLDGTLNQQQREKVIKQFSEDSDILVCFLSCLVY